MSTDLQTRITSIFDFAYTSSSIRVPATTCREVGKILHAGMFAEEIEGRIPGYSLSPSDQKALNGNASSISSRISEDVFALFERMNQKWKLYDQEILFEPSEVGFIVGKLSGLYISDKRHDVFGDALEIFRSRWAKQEGGQFFTDQRVTHMALRMLDFNPLRGDDLVDICAGTGGFLLAGFNRIKELIDSNGGTEKEVAELAAHSLLGQEIDKEVASLGNGTLTARTGSYAASIIETGNSLDRALFSTPKSKIRVGTHICVATNPPFGAKIPVRNEEILCQYELARIPSSNAGKVRGNKNLLIGKSPDILFVEQNVNLLKPGVGRLAIIIPYQIISGPQSLYVRDWIIRNCIVEAVIDLPSETFQPHTGTKTALLLVQRRERPLLAASDADETEVFMATPKWIGHDRRGNAIYAKSPDGKFTPEILSDFGLVEESFARFKKDGTDPNASYSECFSVKMSAIVSDSLLRLNAQSYKPSTFEVENTQLFDKENWSKVKLGDLVTKIFYPGRFKREYVERSSTTIPFLGGSNITEIVVSTEKWLREDDPRLKSLAVEAGWLLITRSGSTGIISSVPEAWNGFAMSEHVIRIIPNKEKLDPYYLLAFLRTRFCQEQLKRGVFGSVIDEISPEFIAELVVPIPSDTSAQLRIAGKMRDAEMARNRAISGISEAVSDFEDLLKD